MCSTTVAQSVPPAAPHDLADKGPVDNDVASPQDNKEQDIDTRTSSIASLPTAVGDSSILPAATAVKSVAPSTETSTTTSSTTSDLLVGSTPVHQEVHISRRRGAKKNHHNEEDTIYSWKEPPPRHQQEKLNFHEHFSSLILRGSVHNTVLEFALLLLPFLLLAIFDYAAAAENREEGHASSNIVKNITMTPLNVEGSMPLRQVAIGLVVCSIIRRIYNTYLEAVYFTFPSLRTQPPKDHRLAGHRNKKDLMGRDKEQLEILESHDKWTLVSQFILNFGLYYALPGFYPPMTSVTTINMNSPAHSPSLALLLLLLERFTKLVLNHYVLSFGMYWTHRSLHVIPWLWDNIHSLHHYAKHPLSRNTYEDHWFDNFLNSIMGHVYAQILVPLDGPTFWFSRIFRILESLEKHSGISCGFNIAHSIQQWLPFAQMPHHHDWHHEGFKGSNYTFSSLGGLWDCIFGTRKGGRFRANNCAAATREDIVAMSTKQAGGRGGEGFFLFNPLWPLVGLTLLIGMKLKIMISANKYDD